MEQISIFDDMYEDYKINKRIKLIEFFAGMGSQAASLKRLEDDGFLPNGFDHLHICEWAAPSIVTYASIHRDELDDYGNDHTIGMTKDDLVDYLFERGVSLNYNEPAERDQLKRKSEDELKLIYNSIIWTHNLVDIQRTKGGDLEITNNGDYCYVMTYSFP